MKDKKIIFPDRDEMLRRLLSINDDLDARLKFYPMLLRSAGKEINAIGIVYQLVVAIHDYTSSIDILKSKKEIYEEVIRSIDVLVEDKDVADEVKEILEKILLNL